MSEKIGWLVCSKRCEWAWRKVIVCHGQRGLSSEMILKSNSCSNAPSFKDSGLLSLSHELWDRVDPSVLLQNWNGCRRRKCRDTSRGISVYHFQTCPLLDSKSVKLHLVNNARLENGANELVSHLVTCPHCSLVQSCAPCGELWLTLD